MLKKKWMILVLAVVSLIGLLAESAVILSKKSETPDLIEMRRAVFAAEQRWNGAKQPGIDCAYAYCVVDLNGAEIVNSAGGLSYDNVMAKAAREGSVVLDVRQNGKIVGKAIFTIEDERLANMKNNKLIAVLSAHAALLIGVIGIYLLYLHLSVYRPFRRMGDYAAAIASGDLDMPLAMDRGNLFGAYTESFNTMRLQIQDARRREYIAYKEKADFIASVNHDLLAPLAVIKSAVVCMGVRSRDTHLPIITDKVNELESLINDLMVTNLEDTSEFRVNMESFDTKKLEEAIQFCDYQNRITQLTLEEDRFICDPIRVKQCLSNVITNSYKYAETSIEVNGRRDGDYYVLEIRDYGDTLSDKEVPLLTTKYFRGANAVYSNGAGLGLHIVDSCMKAQDGALMIYFEGGLHVKLYFLRLKND